MLWSAVGPDLGVDAAGVCVGDDINIDGACMMMLLVMLVVEVVYVVLLLLLMAVVLM